MSFYEFIKYKIGKYNGPTSGLLRVTFQRSPPWFAWKIPYRGWAYSRQYLGKLEKPKVKEMPKPEELLPDPEPSPEDSEDFGEEQEEKEEEYM